MTERGIVARINTLTAAFRAAGAPVIFSTIAALRPTSTGFRVNCALAAGIRRKGHLVTGTANAAIHDDLVVEPSDIVSHRSHGMAPFTGTNLDATLRGYGIDTVVLSGVSTNIALPGAAPRRSRSATTWCWPRTARRAPPRRPTACRSPSTCRCWRPSPTRRRSSPSLPDQPVSRDCGEPPNGYEIYLVIRLTAS